MANHNPADKIELIDMGDGPDAEPKVIEMTETDANHALAADPERYHRAAVLASPPTTLEQRMTAAEQRLEKLDGHHKKQIEARAAEHKRIMSERRKPAEVKPEPHRTLFGGPAAPVDEAEQKRIDKEAADALAASHARAAAPNPNWPAAPPVEQK